MPQPTVLQEPANPADIWELPVGDINILRGDLTSLESNTIVAMDLVTEDATFAGCAGGQKNAGQSVPAQIVVFASGVVKIDATEAAYEATAGLKYAGDNTVVADGSANTIGFVWRKKPTTTRIKMYFNVPALGKLFTVSA